MAKFAILAPIMSTIPTGEGLFQVPLLERVRLARRELERQSKLNTSWDPEKGGRFPDSVVDQVLARYGLTTLTDQEVWEINMNDIVAYTEALVERGKEMGWLPKDFEKDI